tara:strand:- start:510 stop:770 length:261 start_codon:yes stop_codon:yes gene_type:complete
MLKEIKYLIFIFFICLFIFLVSKYYFSDDHKKKSYRSLKTINEKIFKYSINLPIIENDTNNVVEYINQNKIQKKKFNFWKLLEKNE